MSDKTTKKKIITVCASSAFYKHVNQLTDELEKMGYEVRVPKLAHEMREKNDYEVAHYKTWMADPGDFDKKRALMEGHFDEVRASDAILVVNDEKRGIPGYIGGNVLMEISLAYFLDKPVFILNTIDDKHNLYEEILGIGCVQLDGKVKDLKF